MLCYMCVSACPVLPRFGLLKTVVCVLSMSPRSLLLAVAVTLTEHWTNKNSLLACFPHFVSVFRSVFFLSVVPPWIPCFTFNPLSHPGYLLLLLEQGERSLEDNTRLFLDIAHLSFLDDALCTFYNASLTPACRVPSSEDGP